VSGAVVKEVGAVVLEVEVGAVALEVGAVVLDWIVLEVGATFHLKQLLAAILRPHRNFLVTRRILVLLIEENFVFVFRWKNSSGEAIGGAMLGSALIPPVTVGVGTGCTTPRSDVVQPNNALSNSFVINVNASSGNTLKRSHTVQ